MESQRLLSEVASLPNVHVAASMDHVNAPLLWDIQTRDRFSWVWHAVHTYQPYITEVAVAALPSVLTTKRCVDVSVLCWLLFAAFSFHQIDLMRQS